MLGQNGKYQQFFELVSTSLFGVRSWCMQDFISDIDGLGAAWRDFSQIRNSTQFKYTPKTPHCFLHDSEWATEPTSIGHLQGSIPMISQPSGQSSNDWVRYSIITSQPKCYNFKCSQQSRSTHLTFIEKGNTLHSHRVRNQLEILVSRAPYLRVRPGPSLTTKFTLFLSRCEGLQLESHENKGREEYEVNTEETLLLISRSINSSLLFLISS